MSNLNNITLYQGMKCHICGDKYRNLNARTDAFQCQACDHIFRTFDNDPIEYHRDFYRKTHQRDNQEFNADGSVNERFHQARKKIVEKRLHILKPHLSPGDTMLDVGGGAGTFAKVVRPHIKSVEVTELDPNLITEVMRLGFVAYEDDFLTTEFRQQYDWVCAWHVLEHVEDAHSFVRKMEQLSNRYVVIEVPTARKVHKEFDGHYHLFCEKSLRILLEEEGLRIKEMRKGVQKPAILAIAE